MSIKLMSLAFATPYPAIPKLILLSLCDYADDFGACFPSLSTLEKKASCAKSTQSYHVRTFEKIGMISKEKRNRPNGSRASSIYYINIEMLEKNAIVFKKVTPDELRQHKKNVEKIRKIYEKSYQNIRPSSRGEQYPIIHEENSTPVHEETPTSSPREHLEPSLYNHHYSKEEEERRKKFFEDFYKWLPKSNIKNEKFYKKSIKQNLLNCDLKTVENFEEFMSEKNESQKNNIVNQQFELLLVYLFDKTPNEILKSQNTKEYLKVFNKSTCEFINSKNGLVELSSSLENRNYHTHLKMELQKFFLN